MNFGIAIQHDGMAEGWQNAPVTQDQAQSPSQPLPMTSPCTDPLQGFEPTPADALGHGQCACKPSAYVGNLQQGVGVASTHPDNPLLPCGVQEPSSNLGSATLALVEKGNKPVPFEFPMAAAAQAM